MSSVLRDALFQTLKAYGALVQFGAVVPGQERALMYGAAKSGLKGSDGERLAWQIADFLPLALARRDLNAKGVQLHDHYARVDSQRRLRTYRPLNEEPVYVMSIELDHELREADAGTVAEIEKISVESQLVRTALERGSQAVNLESGPPVLNGPDELCDPWDQRPQFDPEPWWVANLGLKTREKPWWKFW